MRRLTAGLRRSAPARLLVAVDEEGGRVARLAGAGLVDPVPAARVLAERRRPEGVRRLGRRLGQQMRALGVDWDLAPVLDVADAPDTTVTGDRSYSGSPHVAAAYGAAFARGLRSGGVATTGKHFPGHGRTTVDSHATLPTISVRRRRLLNTDLVAFRESLRYLDAVMSAHIRYPALDPRRPASLSPATTHLLRQDLGFDGVLITDALEMRAITSRYSVPHAAELAVRAGADMVLVTDPDTVPAVTNRLLSAVRDGRIRRSRWHTAVRRVLTLKGYDDTRIDCLMGRHARR